MNLHKVTMKNGRLAVFIGHDSAEIWGFRYGLTLVIGTLKSMASSGVFVRVIFALRHPIKIFPHDQARFWPRFSAMLAKNLYSTSSIKGVLLTHTDRKG
jgi:hypothetical protein